MFNATDLFKERFQAHIKLLNRYYRYIFNGHFMIALGFTIVAIAIYYQEWLEQLSPDFPAALVLAVALSFVVSYNPVQSFLKEPDKVFLIVKEKELQTYFKYSLIYNYVFQLYIVFIVLAAVAPMFMQAFPDKTMKDFLIVMFIVLLLKAWNLVMNWYMYQVQNIQIRRLDKVIRTLINLLIFYFLLQNSMLVVAAIILFCLLTVNNYFLIQKQAGIAWETLIENDQHRLASFYRFVSMFAEVPHLENRLKKRRILGRLVNRFVPFSHDATYAYLYRLSFIRSSDYLNMYIRLTIIGAIVIYFVPNVWFKLAFVLLFLYMTSFQMISLFHHYRTNIWIDLYPIKEELREQSFLMFLGRITILQAVVFSIVFIILEDYTFLFYALIVGLVFSYTFIHLYVKRKIASNG